MEKNLERNKGITLIALVITIIVLLIFIGVTIATLTGDNGILTKANSAKILTNEGEEKETVSLAYNGSIAETTGDTVSATDMQKQLDDNKIDASAEEVEGKIKVTFNKTGNVYIINANGIIEKRKSLEDFGLKVGDYVDYDEGVGGHYYADNSVGAGVRNSDYDSKNRMVVLESGDFYTEDLNWRVIGVDDLGRLELISESTSSNDLYLANSVGWSNLVDILNECCNSLYGNGSKAYGARSLNIDDIRNLAGVITEEDIKAIDNSYGKLFRYRFVTGGTSLEYQEYLDKGDYWSDWSPATMNNFTGKFFIPGFGDYISSDNLGTSDVVKVNYYSSYGVIQRIKDEYIKDIFAKQNNSWLANPCLSTNGYALQLDVQCVFSNNPLGNIFGMNSYSNCKIRPVVILNDDIEIDTSKTSGSSFEDAYTIK
ncbi:MAG: hypothetical protein ACI4VH_07325 [Clostridia bacterium]